MKIFVVCLIIFFKSYSIAQKVEPTNKAALKIYQKHLSIIKEYLKFFEGEEYSDDAFNNLDKSSAFLVKITGIGCSNYNDVGCNPSKEDYKDWKVWLRLNKSNLYINEDTVRINGNHIPVRKNPRKYFISKLKFVKNLFVSNFIKTPNIQIQFIF